MKLCWICAAFAALMFAGVKQSLADEVLAREFGCFECHNRADNKVIGPSFSEIAVKNRDNALARDALIAVVKNGGKGNWTEVSRGVPMPPYSPRLSNVEIELLVDWVLGH